MFTKTVLKQLQAQNDELNEEIMFLAKQMEFADDQNIILEEKAKQLKHGKHK